MKITRHLQAFDLPRIRILPGEDTSDILPPPGEDADDDPVFRDDGSLIDGYDADDLGESPDY